MCPFDHYSAADIEIMRRRSSFITVQLNKASIATVSSPPAVPTFESQWILLALNSKSVLSHHFYISTTSLIQCVGSGLDFQRGVSPDWHYSAS